MSIDEEPISLYCDFVCCLCCSCISIPRFFKRSLSLIGRVILLAGLHLCCARAEVKNFGFTVNFSHTASYTSPSDPWFETDSFDGGGGDIDGFEYARILNASGGWGVATSNLKFDIKPGVLRVGWVGDTNVAGGIGLPEATAESRVRMNLNLIWNETFTIDHVIAPVGTELEILLCQRLIYTIHSYEPQLDAATFFSRTDFSPSSGPGWTVTDQISYPPDSGQGLDYRAEILKLKVGDTISLYQVITTIGQSYRQVTSGESFVDGSGVGYIDVDSWHSQRIGIRGLTPGTRIVSASGHVYPEHAMSPEDVEKGLRDLRIKSKAYDPQTRFVSFSVDAIPGASYVLEKSTDLKSWRSVSAPQIPPNFQEITFVDSLVNEPRGFWRIRATSL